MLKMKTTKRYDKYKDSGIEWIGEIPDSWCVRKLNSLLNAIGSGTTPKGNDNYYDGDIYWLNTGDLNDSYISTINKTVTEIALQECSTLKLLPKDSVVIAMYGATIGKLGILMFPATTNQACCVMSCSDQLNNEYLFYLLFAAREFIINLSYGAGQPNISQETIKSFRLSFPSIKEQEAIAGYLDRKCGVIDETIEKQMLVIEKLKEYKQSIITQAVTKGLDKSAPMKDSGIEWIGQIPQHWEIEKLKKMVKMPLQYGANESGEDYNPKYPRYIRITDIKIENNLLKDDGKLSLSPEKAKDYLLSNNDILFARSGATVGKTFLYKEEYGKSAFAGYLIRASFKDNVVPKYVYYYTLSYSYEEWKRRIFVQATIQNIGANKYNQLEIPYCSLSEQKLIAEFLDKKCSEIDKTIADKEKLIEKLVEYKKSLIYECVTGKRKVVA